MEREGSGFDLMYERLQSSGRTPPVPTEGVDSVCITVVRRIVKPQVIALIDEADQRFQLSQRERITLGILAQADGLTAIELCRQVEVASADELKRWLGRLPGLGLVHTTGRTKGQRYFVEPALLRVASVPTVTTLSGIAPHRLRELVREDLRRHPLSAIGEVHRRVRPAVARSQLKRVLAELVDRGEATMAGVRRSARYRLADARL